MYLEQSADPHLAENLRVRLGLSEPIHVQYFVWLKNAFTGDFGVSFRKQRPVIDVLAEAIPKTLLLTGVTFIVSLGLGIFLGVLSAVYIDSWFERLLRFVMLLLYSIPEFWIALMLILLFSLQLDLLPVSQMYSPNVDVLPFWDRQLDLLEHLVLPVTVLTITSMTVIARNMRGSMLDIIHQDYVRTARAKGLSEWRVYGTHVFRNAVLPIVTLIGVSFPFLLGGAVIVETIFSWPGMGFITIEAIFTRDYPMIIAATFLSGVMVVFGNFLADVLYAVVDPRIRLH